MSGVPGLGPDTNSQVAAGIDKTFAKQLDDFIEKYRPVLETLAK